MNRWWRATQVIGWVHSAVLVVVVVAMALRLPTFTGTNLVVGGFAVLVVLAITAAVVAATWKIRRRTRGGLMVLVLYGVIGTALSGQLLAGAIMSAGRIGSIGYLLGPVGLVLAFVVTAGVPTVTYVATHYPGAMGRRP